MKKVKPLISIVLPTCNSGKFLKDCLESLVAQTYKNIEIIAVDDASTDNSFKILKNFKRQLTKRSKKKAKKFRLYQNVKRYGLAVCLNRGAKRAKGDFITFASPYDVTSKNRLKRELYYLLNNPKVVAVGSQTVFINKNNKRIGKSAFPLDHETIYKTLSTGLVMQFESVLINKNLLPKDVLKFKLNPSPFIFIDVFMRLLPYGEFANIGEKLYFHRNENNGSLKKLDNLLNFLKLFIKSVTIYDYRFSLDSLFASTRLLTKL